MGLNVVDIIIFIQRLQKFFFHFWHVFYVFFYIFGNVFLHLCCPSPQFCPVWHHSLITLHERSSLNDDVSLYYKWSNSCVMSTIVWSAQVRLTLTYPIPTVVWCSNITPDCYKGFSSMTMSELQVPAWTGRDTSDRLLSRSSSRCLW